MKGSHPRNASHRFLSLVQEGQLNGHRHLRVVERRPVVRKLVSASQGTTRSFFLFSASGGSSIKLFIPHLCANEESGVWSCAGGVS